MLSSEASSPTPPSSFTTSPGSCEPLSGCNVTTHRKVQEMQSAIQRTSAEVWFSISEHATFVPHAFDIDATDPSAPNPFDRAGQKELRASPITKRALVLCSRWPRRCSTRPSAQETPAASNVCATLSSHPDTGRTPPDGPPPDLNPASAGLSSYPGPAQPQTHRHPPHGQRQSAPRPRPACAPHRSHARSRDLVAVTVLYGAPAGAVFASVGPLRTRDLVAVVRDGPWRAEMDWCVENINASE
ncbi:hypothetical protein DENSPDRAFT_619695 [Dentipellis sp. KUC8613]|nr:hypothetical protein DENSPDRAFT_619695 [Dentipellis sp. KUC8613]